MFGIVLARLYVSGSFVSAPPIAHAITARRRKPVTRESAVPTLITAVARVSVVPSSPVRGTLSFARGSGDGSDGGPAGGAAIAGDRIRRTVRVSDAATALVAP